MGTLTITRCDSKGRIYLREALRARYGKRFVLLETPRELVLLPVPDDPVADLADQGSTVSADSIAALRGAGRAAARAEVDGELR